MGVGQRDVHALQGDAVAHLAPVSVDHVGGGGHHGGLAEFGHHLTAGEAVLRAAGVLAVGQHLLQLGGDLQRLGQAPAAVGVQIHTGVGEGLLDGLHRLQLLLGLQHAALELEVLKAVFLVGGLGQSNNGLGGHGLLMAQAVPLAVGIRLGSVGQVGLLAVAHIEQVAQETHPLPLDAIAHQRGGGHIQILAQQVQQRGLNGGDHMHAGAQIEGLLAAHVVLDVGIQPGAHLVQGSLVIADGGTHHQVLHILQRGGDLLAAGHLAHALGAGGIGEDDDVAGEIGRMRTGKIQLHAVPPGNGIYFHLGDHRCFHN